MVGDSTLFLSNCTFQNLTADQGGAIYALAHRTIYVEHTRFIKNTAPLSGNHLYFSNSGFLSTFVNCTFSDQHSAQAIYGTAVQLSFIASTFVSQTPRTLLLESGSAIHCTACPFLEIRNSTFTGFQGRKGGAVYAYLPIAFTAVVTNSTFVVLNSDFWNNSGTEGGAIYF